MNSTYALRLKEAARLKGISFRPRRTVTRFDWADVLAQQCRAMHLPQPEREQRLIPGRQFRTDLCWRTPRRLFAECDGGEFVQGRHARGTGMQADCEKWNALTLAGWAGLRFTGRQVKSGYAIQTLTEVLRGAVGETKHLDASADPDAVRKLQNLLAQAGAVVLLDTIANWTPAQRDEADTWAVAQIDATGTAQPGQSVSVHWPDHVSVAVHGEAPGEQTHGRKRR